MIQNFSFEFIYAFQVTNMKKKFHDMIKQRTFIPKVITTNLITSRDNGDSYLQISKNSMQSFPCYCFFLRETKVQKRNNLLWIIQWTTDSLVPLVGQN